MKITLCGSTKFKDEFLRLNKELSKLGHVVYSVSCFGHSGDTLTDDEKETLDLVHLRKILESDVVVIATNKDNYIGDSTRREIKWAKMNNIPVYSGQEFPRSVVYPDDMFYPLHPKTAVGSNMSF